ncbi:MAG: exodeoxyribonuclease VII small subunit [Tannerella sp.]|jgi:exodeoxyribonuclease VII small subunit|nr:exodeoxyribonuclease VII small subunit [Tannerella sp.]
MEKEMAYTESVECLRAIVAEVQQEEDLNLLLERVKEASQLIKSCKEKLFKVDGEVKKMLEELE